MINVYSFQKITSSQDCLEQKNISKTSQFHFGQNYKKLINNSKANFDFRRFLQKHSNTKKHFTTIAPRQISKRNPLQQVSVTQANTQNNLQNKAFKIRCYSRKAPKQNQKQQDLITSKLIKYKPRIYPMKQLQSQEKRAKTNIDNKKCIKMHKFDNFQELQSIANNIKIFYNDFISQTDKTAQKAIIFDINYLITCMKSSTTKANQKDKDQQYLRKKVIFLLKRIIEDKFSAFPMQKTTIEERPQIIFKTRSQSQTYELLKTLDQCQFGTYYCIFSIQYRCTESVNTYLLTKIADLAQNIIMVDNLESFMFNPPLLNSRHFVALSTFNQKNNFGNSLQNLFQQIQTLQIRFSAQQFQNEQVSFGQMVEIKFNQLLQKVKQRRNLKQYKRQSRQKKQRCHSSHEGNYLINEKRNQQKTLQNFKQKMIKYLKIIQAQNNLQSKRSKQLTSTIDDLQCLSGRQKCSSKTNNQIVSQLVRLNNHVHKQISNYQRKMGQFYIQNKQENNNNNQNNNNYLRFQKAFVNNLH